MKQMQLLMTTGLTFKKAAVDIASLLMKNEYVDVNKANYRGETPIMSVLARDERNKKSIDYKEMNIDLAKLLIRKT